MAIQDGEGITISKTEYDALVADRRALAGFHEVLHQMLQALDARPHRDIQVLVQPVPVPIPGPASRSAIDSDVELSIFIRPLLGHETLDRIVESCREHFGPDRTPSKSAIHRFWMRLRHSQSVFKTCLKET